MRRFYQLHQSLTTCIEQELSIEQWAPLYTSFFFLGRIAPKSKQRKFKALKGGITQQYELIGIGSHLDSEQIFQVQSE